MFIPKRVIFEPGSLDYPLGKELQKFFSSKGMPISFTASHNRITSIPGRTPQEAYREGKGTLVIGVRKSKDFQTCKPSANYQLPLVTGCAGMCEYCYLMTNMGKKPYIRLYVNIDEILNIAANYINQRKPDITVFEGAATSDPVAVEPYSGSLAKTIEFFAKEPEGRFRFVTKFNDLDSLLEVKHNDHTRIRLSVNIEPVIRNYEHGTPSLLERLGAAKKIAAAGYPLGLMIGPIIMVDNWQREYEKLLHNIGSSLENIKFSEPLTLELISHRFTPKAKKVLTEIFPKTTLPLEEEQRQYKVGQFGYGKYTYSKDDLKQLRLFFEEKVPALVPNAKIEYLV